MAWMGLKVDVPCVGRIDELVSYFEERWLNGPYPLKTWNYYQMKGPKTNNHVEGWHIDGISKWMGFSM